MPWNQTDEMSERVKLMADYLSGDYGVSDLARVYGVSRNCVYKWIDRYEQEGPGGLEERSRAPHSQARAIDAKVVAYLLDLKRQWPRWGAPKLLARMVEKLGEECCPAESTVSEILKRHGLSFARKKKRHATPSAAPL